MNTETKRTTKRAKDYGTLAGFARIAKKPLKTALAAAVAAHADARKAEAGYFRVVAESAHAAGFAPTPKQLGALAKELAGVDLKTTSATTLASVAGQASRLAGAGLPMPASIATASTQKAVRDALARAIKAGNLGSPKGRKPAASWASVVEGMTPAQRTVARKSLQDFAAGVGAAGIAINRVSGCGRLAALAVEAETSARERIGAIDEVTAKQGRGKSD